MKATNALGQSLTVCPTAGGWVFIYDPNNLDTKWYVNTTLLDGTLQIGSKFYDCLVQGYSGRIFTVMCGSDVIRIDERMLFDDFVAHLKQNPELSAVARMLFALRRPNTELETQLKPSAYGDYTQVVEAIEKHRTWALEKAWIDELQPE